MIRPQITQRINLSSQLLRSSGPLGPSILDIDPEPIPSLDPSLKFNLDPFKKDLSQADPRIGPITTNASQGCLIKHPTVTQV